VLLEKVDTGADSCAVVPVKPGPLTIPCLSLLPAAYCYIPGKSIASVHDLLLALQAFPVVTVTQVIAHGGFLSLFSRIGSNIALSCLPSSSSEAPLLLITDF